VTKSHRDRGVVTEQLLARFLRGHGFPHAERAVRTGVRTADRTVADPGDITGTPGLVWQAKALKPITRAENNVLPWMVETEQQRADAGADLGVLVLRRDQRPPEQWFAFLPLADAFGRLGGAYPAALLDHLDDRETLVAWPARFYLGDLVTLLRGCGYGDPLTDPRPALEAPVPMTATP
jgi:hypothetical protein